MKSDFDLVGYLVKPVDSDLQVICNQHDPRDGGKVEGRLTGVPNGTLCYLCGGERDDHVEGGWVAQGEVTLDNRPAPPTPTSGESPSIRREGVRREALHLAMTVVAPSVSGPETRTKELLESASAIEEWLLRDS